MADPIGIYVHVPFCRVRCDYCNFAIVVGGEPQVEDYRQALQRQALGWSQTLEGRRFDTLHLGGGTPSRLAPDQLAPLIERLVTLFALDSEAEIALEANPEDVDLERVACWIAAGVNRLTIGVQALSATGLRSIGRPNEPSDGARALAVAAGRFRSLGVDLIYGRPAQTVPEWDAELAAVADWPVQHYSVYALESDERTPLSVAIERGQVPRPDPDVAAAMYERAWQRLEELGVLQYEISNGARPGAISRHNLKYWTDRPYLGLGPSAASYVDGARWSQPRAFDRWLAQVAAGIEPIPEPFDADRRCGEALVFGLRRLAGVALGPLAARYGADPLERRRPGWERGIASGLLELDRDRLALTRRGLLLADEVFVDLL